MDHCDAYSTKNSSGKKQGQRYLFFFSEDAFIVKERNHLQQSEHVVICSLTRYLFSMEENGLPTTKPDTCTKMVLARVGTQ
ncbi:MAG TPA: hypothetical protein VGN34_17490 [Ktedonobacteraceae bacterium]